MEIIALVDTGSQIPALPEGFQLRIWVDDPSTGGLLHLKGTGNIVILDKGYVEASITIPGLP